MTVVILNLTGEYIDWYDFDANATVAKIVIKLNDHILCEVPTGVQYERDRQQEVIEEVGADLMMRAFKMVS